VSITGILKPFEKKFSPQISQKPRVLKRRTLKKKEKKKKGKL
jgi:hypothetical protein